MSDLKIVDGRSSVGTYVVIAAANGLELAVRPLLRYLPGVDRGGNPVVKRALNLWFRVHLQKEGRTEVPTKRAIKPWGSGYALSEVGGYYRKDAFVQLAYKGEATNHYLTEKARLGSMGIIEVLLEPITLKVEQPYLEDSVDWLATQLVEELHSYAGPEGTKNTPAYRAKPVFTSEA